MVQDTLTGTVVAPWSPLYDTARVDYNSLFPPFSPAYIVYCQKTLDVKRAVHWAVHHKVPFRIRSGGHSYEAYSLLNGGLVIDVSRINHVHYNAVTGIAQIGAGAKLLDIYQELWDQSRVSIPGGSCATVGIAGLTLGGGFGLISRKFGLTCDSLESLTMVGARGQILEVSASRHPDLFWASRGGGGNNFGAVTEFRFRAYPVSDVSIFFLQWEWNRLPEVLRGFQQWSDPRLLDDRIVAILTLPAAITRHVSISGQFLGEPRELLPLLAPLFAIAGMTEKVIRAMPYIDAVKHFAGLSMDPERWIAQGVPNRETFKNTSAYTFEIFSDSAIGVIQAALLHVPGPASLVQLDTYGGAIARIADNATAFPHRKARACLQFQTYWSEPAQNNAHIRWVENFRRAMLPYTIGAYVNYCDGNIKRWPRDYYDGNLARLLAIKKRWDPHNVFRFPQGLSQLT